MNLFHRRLLLATTLLALFVVGLGAYVRLSDAGLGCPDWPGCYGHLSVPQTAADHTRAAAAFPGRPVEAHKAWKEMIHRYAAGTLGLLILLLNALAYFQRRGRGLSTALLGVVLLQALLGMWTVTWLLKPIIVTLHLLGGMTTLALLVALSARQGKQEFLAPFGLSYSKRALNRVEEPTEVFTTKKRFPTTTRLVAALALLAVIAQIALGGWVSSNYAALACNGFPACNGSFNPPADYAQAFALTRELGKTAAGGLLPLEALVAIHWTHRLGALVVVLLVGFLVSLLWRRRERCGAALLATLLLAQVCLGIANVWLALPLPLAVAHNLGAALLLSALVILATQRSGAAGSV